MYDFTVQLHKWTEDDRDHKSCVLTVVHRHVLLINLPLLNWARGLLLHPNQSAQLNFFFFLHFLTLSSSPTYRKREEVIIQKLLLLEGRRRRKKNPFTSHFPWIPNKQTKKIFPFIMLAFSLSLSFRPCVVLASSKYLIYFVAAVFTGCLLCFYWSRCELVNGGSRCKTIMHADWKQEKKKSYLVIYFKSASNRLVGVINLTVPEHLFGLDNMFEQWIGLNCFVILTKPC